MKFCLRFGWKDEKMDCDAESIRTNNPGELGEDFGELWRRTTDGGRRRWKDGFERIYRQSMKLGGKERKVKVMVNKQTEYVLKHGKAVYDTWTPSPDNCVPYDGVEYLGHRLGQVWAMQTAKNHPPVRVHKRIINFTSHEAVW